MPGDAKGRTYAQAIADKLATLALAGDIRAASELADRAEGKARQTMQIENTALKHAFERMSEAELDAYAREGQLPDSRQPFECRSTYQGYTLQISGSITF